MGTLFDKLSENDKELIVKYIEKNGIDKEEFCGLEKYLRFWDTSKRKLYHLLGDNFIVKIPYEYEKDEEELNQEIDKLLGNYDAITFIRELNKAMYESILLFSSDMKEEEYWDLRTKLKKEYGIFIKEIRDANASWITNKISRNYIFILAGKKELKISAGTKIIKAINKVLLYFKNNVHSYSEMEEKLEAIRIKHSMILNDKVMKGQVVLSIHPLDFITMSDNSYDWTSCMSWEHHGAYHLGSVEMMNSNNVICCYLEGKEAFHFDKEDPKAKWNNKKWRSLYNITRDIILQGKAYPYYNEKIQLFILERLRELAEKNWNCKYQFGPELYRDMIHIDNNDRMENNRYWIKNNNTIKHNILFDTKAMYNDYLNNPTYKFWCVRNKVKKNKIISYSGKTPCLCCGDDFLHSLHNTTDYNERYEGSFLLCENCLESHVCECCQTYSIADSKKVIYMDKEVIFCNDCFRRRVRDCPCCGRPFLIDKIRKEWLFFVNFDYEIGEKVDYYDLPYSSNKDFLKGIYICDSCYEKVPIEVISVLHGPLFTPDKLKIVRYDTEKLISDGRIEIVGVDKKAVLPVSKYIPNMEVF